MHPFIHLIYETNKPPIFLTSGLIGSGLRCDLGSLLFSIFHFSRHWGSWIEIDFEPNSRPQI